MVPNRKLAYEIFCTGCKQPIGYTNHAFQNGELLDAKSHWINHPNEVRAKPGDRLKCECPGGRPKGMSLWPNPGYKNN